MHRIVASISTLAEHLAAVQTTPDAYRPDACPRCGVAGLWGHGCYYRKGERSTGGATREPVPVPRYLCPGCIRTCSRLPSFMSPRRWYCWAVQQVVLLLLLSGASLNDCCGCTGRALRTVVRWRDWLKERGESFAFFLRSRFPELGRICADHGAFWRHVIDSLSLAQAMAWLDRDLVVP
jgi:transposase-like protein